ncbi:putative membrane protein [Bizionia echini]|uniref:Putative membrane protein n=1 Tax=Bizionia echini TaxID=649333 RepID=A0A1I4YQK2_9FLAO|nr:SHOCT domain-containing protein [Bizionia echini]SFN39910.1 putative membrane protein [Bizionia echini]|tara:strand:+ start:1901 stop:2089 length:189 start_codon:yes stop_codon:yes gene_type:complete
MMMWWWILIPIVLVLGIFLYNGKNRQYTVKKENPLDILNNRFAKGEISKEEYEEQKRMLDKK